MCTIGCFIIQNTIVVLEIRIVFYYIWCLLIFKVGKNQFSGLWLMNSPDPLADSTNSLSKRATRQIRFMHSSSWCLRLQNFEFLAKDWTRIITKNYFVIIKIVFSDLIMMILFQSKDNCQNYKICISLYDWLISCKLLIWVVLTYEFN